MIQTRRLYLQSHSCDRGPLTACWLGWKSRNLIYLLGQDCPSHICHSCDRGPLTTESVGAKKQESYLSSRTGLSEPHLSFLRRQESQDEGVTLSSVEERHLYFCSVDTHLLYSGIMMSESSFTRDCQSRVPTDYQSVLRRTFSHFPLFHFFQHNSSLIPKAYQKQIKCISNVYQMYLKAHLTYFSHTFDMHLVNIDLEESGMKKNLTYHLMQPMAE